MWCDGYVRVIAVAIVAILCAVWLAAAAAVGWLLVSDACIIGDGCSKPASWKVLAALEALIAVTGAAAAVYAASGARVGGLRERHRRAARVAVSLACTWWLGGLLLLVAAD